MNDSMKIDLDETNPYQKKINEKAKRDRRTRACEAARQRYHRLTPDEKKDLNLKRTLAQKRKRQREKELSELEQILRMTNDIVDDPEVTEQLREKRMRARWAEVARTRYQRMSSEERRVYNLRRRVGATAMTAISNTSDPEGKAPDDEKIETAILEAKRRRAEAARKRYHAMSEEKKKVFNKRRAEWFRQRRKEEAALLTRTNAVGQLDAQSMESIQRLMMRNARRAETARKRYQRMTPEQRLTLNQRRRNRKKACAEAREERLMEAETRDKSDPFYMMERDIIRLTDIARARQARTEAATTSATASAALF